MGFGEAPHLVPAPPQAPAASSDQDLASRMARGDERALEELYDRYSAAVYGLVSRLLPDPRDREEVLQDTFLTVWRRAASYDGRRGRLLSWLMSIAHNQAIDLLRRRKHTPPVASLLDWSPAQPGSPARAPGGEPAAGAMAGLDERDALARALQRLRPEEQQVVWLAYFQGYTHREIATRHSIPLGTVKSRMRSAVEHLRHLLAHDQQPETRPGGEAPPTGGR